MYYEEWEQEYPDLRASVPQPNALHGGRHQLHPRQTRRGRAAACCSSMRGQARWSSGQACRPERSNSTMWISPGSIAVVIRSALIMASGYACDPCQFPGRVVTEFELGHERQIAPGRGHACAATNHSTGREPRDAADHRPAWHTQNGRCGLRHGSGRFGTVANGHRRDAGSRTPNTQRDAEYRSARHRSTIPDHPVDGYALAHRPAL